MECNYNDDNNNNNFKRVTIQYLIFPMALRFEDLKIRITITM